MSRPELGERGELLRPMKPRTVTESQTVFSQIMLPDDANPVGNVHGGTIAKLVDSAAGVAAMRHCRAYAASVVTARIDAMDFVEPVHIGDVITLRASVNDVGRTSMEIGVRVDAENVRTGEIRHVASAYLVFVAVDEHGHPVPVPPLIVETADDRRRQAAAVQRRAARKRREPS